MDICIITGDALLARFIELELCEAGYSICSGDALSDARLYICDLDFTEDIPSTAIGFSYAESKRSLTENFLLRPINTAKLRNAVSKLLDAPSSAENSEIEVDRKSRKAKTDKGEVRLSEKELALLGLLASGETLTRDDGEKIFGSSDGNVVDVYIHYLRKKLSKVCDGETVKSMRGTGYRLADTVSVKFT